MSEIDFKQVANQSAKRAAKRAIAEGMEGLGRAAGRQWLKRHKNEILAAMKEALEKRSRQLISGAVKETMKNTKIYLETEKPLYSIIENPDD